MKLKKLVRDIPAILIKGPKEIEITGICANSKLVSPGNLFIAKKGFLDDGIRYIGEAIQAGATAVLTDMYDPSLKITQLIYHDIQAIEGLLASLYYQSPSQELFLVGITGTNGKTTTSYLIKSILDALGEPAGLIGTIEYILGKQCYQAIRTTPDVVSNHKMLREMVHQGCKSAVMEATSHALDQGRVNEIEFDVAIFTNLSVDHLDYHGSLEEYCDAKNKLFRQLTKGSKKKFPKRAIVNNDDPWTPRILEGCKAPVFTYGIENKSDLMVSNIRFSPFGTEFNLLYQGQSIPCFTPLIGRFNIYNCLAAVSVGLVKGVSLETLVPLLRAFKQVSGRLEPVANSLGLKIYVDFAHSSDSLANVLETLREFKKGRLITVFGCGGDRDKGKRALMAEAAEKASDICVITSDNPRSEDPETICNEVINSFKNPKNHFKEVDRKKAISLAVEMANKEDLILIAGKGHETYQIFAHKTIEFDDRKIAAQACQEKDNRHLTF